MNEKLEELNRIVGKLREFFLSNHAESPIAIVLDERNARALIKSIVEPWHDMHFVQSETRRVLGVQIRFESAPRFPASDRTVYPIGTRVEKVSGPEWNGIVVGHYSSSFTPDGVVIECTSPGAKGQVHVEPAKRIRKI